MLHWEFHVVCMKCAHTRISQFKRIWKANDLSTLNRPKLEIVAFEIHHHTELGREKYGFDINNAIIELRYK
jgi:hypothetical protein